MTALRNRTIVITGASSGFGKGVALTFADTGADLVLAARREPLLDELAAECRHRGARAIAVPTDVSQRSQIDALARAAREEFGRIDIWINNAGVGTFGRFDEVPLEEHEQVVRTNLLGAMYGSHAALREFRRTGRGTLINVASFAGLSSSPYIASYVASKHGLRGLNMALRQELIANHEHGIDVCTVLPTSMDTPFFGHAGNHTGHPVQPIPPVYDPQKVIDAIFRLAFEPQDEVVIGARGAVGRIAGRLAPQAMERRMAYNVHRTQMEQDATAPDSAGSLFNPVDSGTEVRGGWKSSGSKSAGITVAALLAAGATAGAVALRRYWDRKWEEENVA